MSRRTAACLTTPTTSSRSRASRLTRGSTEVTGHVPGDAALRRASEAARGRQRLSQRARGLRPAMLNDTEPSRPRKMLWLRDRTRPTLYPPDRSRDQNSGLETEPKRLVSKPRPEFRSGDYAVWCPKFNISDSNAETVTASTDCGWTTSSTYSAPPTHKNSAPPHRHRPPPASGLAWPQPSSSLF